jgi:Cys-rich protein (TIGR01571 family)
MCAQGWMRENVRTRYGIKGDLVIDLVTSWFCSPCSLTQESLELGEEEAALTGQR